MKGLHIYIEKEGVAEALHRRLQENANDEAPEIYVHTLPHEFAKTMMNRESLIELGLSDWKDSLYLTDNAQFAALLSGGDYPVLVYVHEGNKDKSFEKVKYVIEGFDDIDMDYFFKIWQRLTGNSWHILDTKRCRIRETGVTDLDAFYELYKEPSITQYMENLFSDRDEEKAYIETYAKTVYEFYGFGMWTVTLKETGQVIGRAGISMREGFDDPEFGFMIGVPWQEKGIATEVCKGILEYARDELGFEKVIAFVKPGNVRSVGLLKKLGFVYDTEADLQDGQYQLYMKHLKAHK